MKIDTQKLQKTIAEHYNRIENEKDDLGVEPSLEEIEDGCLMEKRRQYLQKAVRDIVEFCFEDLDEDEFKNVVS